MSRTDTAKCPGCGQPMAYGSRHRGCKPTANTATRHPTWDEMAAYFGRDYDFEKDIPQKEISAFYAGWEARDEEVCRLQSQLDGMTYGRDNWMKAATEGAEINKRLRDLVREQLHWRKADRALGGKLNAAEDWIARANQALKKEGQ